MDIAIIANGYSPESEKCKNILHQCSIVIAADGGIKALDQMGIIPKLWVGDFDSTSDELQHKYAHIEKKAYPRDKDLTDTEIAIEAALSYSPTRIILFAGVGDRQDHSLRNLLLLRKYIHLLYILTDNETLFAIDKELFLPITPGQTLSFIPIYGPVRVKRSSGLKWPLDGMVLDDRLVSLSNRATLHKVELKIGRNPLLCSIMEEENE